MIDTRPVSVGDSMGIYEREYYRDDSRGSGWFSGPDAACRTLIALNVVVYICQFIFPNLTDYLKASATTVFAHYEVWRLLTAAFAHDVDSPFHLLFNMLLLWTFGKELESLYGLRDFLFLYLTAAVVSTLGWTALDSFIDGGRNSVIGASGAVLALAVVYALFYPRREFLVMFVLKMEVWVLVSLGIVFDLLFLLSRSDSGVAYAAHLSGAAYGLAFKTFDLRLSRFTSGRWRRPKLRIVRPEPREREREIPIARAGQSWSPEPASPSRSTMSVVLPQELLDAKLDEVLAKIAREGRGNLNDEDNKVLQEASRRARNRRSDRP